MGPTALAPSHQVGTRRLVMRVTLRRKLRVSKDVDWEDGEIRLTQDGLLGNDPRMKNFPTDASEDDVWVFIRSWETVGLGLLEPL